MDGLSVYKAYLEIQPAVLLDRTVPPSVRSIIRNILAGLLAVSILILTAGLSSKFGSFFDSLFGSFGSSSLPSQKILLTATIVLAMLFIATWLVEFFHNSLFYGSNIMTFDMAMAMPYSKSGDVVRAFMKSPQGRWILLRAGVSPDELKRYIEKRSTVLLFENLFFDSVEHQKIDLAEYVALLIRRDGSLKVWLDSQGIDVQDIIYAGNWIDRRQDEYVAGKRWWSKEAFSRVPGVGKDWTYGSTFYLDSYSRDITFSSRTSFGNANFGQTEINEMEQVLAKSRDANVLLVGDRSAGVMDMIYSLAGDIQGGHAHPEIAHYRVVILDQAKILNSFKDKNSFEDELNKIFFEAATAGNIIMVIENLASFIGQAQGIGVNLIEILDPFLDSSEMHVIGVVGPDDFHQYIESNPVLVEKFEKILVQDMRGTELERFIQKRAEVYESSHNLFFEVGALRALSEAVNRYYGGFAGYDKVNDLFEELVPFIISKKVNFVTKQLVLEMVKGKTGIPMGIIDDSEKQVLIHLEEILHKKVVGQEEAIDAISNAMRRARTGINNANRPMGSFLFLGPTGVGKTETAKTLASAFFGKAAVVSASPVGVSSLSGASTIGAAKDGPMIRLDMSEYKSGDGLKRLIGSFESGHQGLLANMVRDKQYGVLLLDEFEKASKEVHDIFLQILDEGFFSDVKGKKVFLRNMIIIATSNAGSELIWSIMEEERGATNALEKHKSEIITSLISRGLFRPELINRFDGVILFHPLSASQRASIALLMLEALNKRLENQGIKVEPTDDLIKYIAAAGDGFSTSGAADGKFGARSMNRIIEEKVENYVAKKIITGQAHFGTTLIIPKEDIAGFDNMLTSSRSSGSSGSEHPSELSQASYIMPNQNATSNQEITHKGQDFKSSLYK